MSDCPLCTTSGGQILWQDEACRLVLVDGDDGRDFPGFCRVIWRAHVAEMSDLSGSERRHLMNAVFAAELAVRETMQPDKINLASFGNMVPHLHWHVIPRWRDDSRFPAPIWSPLQRAGTVPPARPEGSTLGVPTFSALATAFSRALAELEAES